MLRKSIILLFCTCFGLSFTAPALAGGGIITDARTVGQKSKRNSQVESNRGLSIPAEGLTSIENELYLLVSMWFSESGWALDSDTHIDFYQPRGQAETDEESGCQQAPILPWFLLGLIPFVTRRKQNSIEA
ncbi:MAG: hypothetical protein VYA34_04655 [Myxococcota bacterium]|nr:hypothetical protein [Myxococcota bacterium]